MRWIALAIVVFVVPYTVLTLVYRKKGKAFEPFVDTRERAATSRLVDAGYRRIALEARRAADSGATVVRGAAVEPAPGGLPAELVTALIQPPALPASIESAVAAGSVGRGEPYTIQFTSGGPDRKQRTTGAQLYLRKNALVVVPTLEQLDGELLARSASATLQVTVPAGTLAPGRYEVLLAGAGASRRWVVEVR